MFGSSLTRLSHVPELVSAFVTENLKVELRTPVLQALLSPTALGIAARHNRTEASLILRGSDERAHHAAIVVPVAVVQDVQPEVIAVVVRIAAQIAEVLHQHKRRVVLRLLEPAAFHHAAHYQTATLVQRRLPLL